MLGLAGPRGLADFGEDALLCPHLSEHLVQLEIQPLEFQESKEHGGRAVVGGQGGWSLISTDSNQLFPSKLFIQQFIHCRGRDSKSNKT